MGVAIYEARTAAVVSVLALIQGVKFARISKPSYTVGGAYTNDQTLNLVRLMNVIFNKGLYLGFPHTYVGLLLVLCDKSIVDF